VQLSDLSWRPVLQPLPPSGHRFPTIPS
jgi:hypothetical protein